jgi:hypothetical protein
MSWTADSLYLYSFFCAKKEGVFRSEVQAPCILTSDGVSQIYVLIALPTDKMLTVPQIRSE